MHLYTESGLSFVGRIEICKSSSCGVLLPLGVDNVPSSASISLHLNVYPTEKVMAHDLLHFPEHKTVQSPSVPCSHFWKRPFPSSEKCFNIRLRWLHSSCSPRGWLDITMPGKCSTLCNGISAWLNEEYFTFRQLLLVEQTQTWPLVADNTKKSHPH